MYNCLVLSSTSDHVVLLFLLTLESLPEKQSKMASPPGLAVDPDYAIRCLYQQTKLPLSVEYAWKAVASLVKVQHLTAMKKHSPVLGRWFGDW